MALPLRFEGLLQAGVVKDYAEPARLGHVSRGAGQPGDEPAIPAARPSRRRCCSCRGRVRAATRFPLWRLQADRLDVGLGAQRAAVMGRPWSAADRAGAGPASDGAGPPLQRLRKPRGEGPASSPPWPTGRRRRAHVAAGGRGNWARRPQPRDEAPRSCGPRGRALGGRVYPAAARANWPRPGLTEAVQSRLRALAGYLAQEGGVKGGGGGRSPAGPGSRSPGPPSPRSAPGTSMLRPASARTRAAASRGRWACGLRRLSSRRRGPGRAAPAAAGLGAAPFVVRLRYRGGAVWLPLHPAAGAGPASPSPPSPSVAANSGRGSLRPPPRPGRRGRVTGPVVGPLRPATGLGREAGASRRVGRLLRPGAQRSGGPGRQTGHVRGGRGHVRHLSHLLGRRRVGRFFGRPRAGRKVSRRDCAGRQPGRRPLPSPPLLRLLPQRARPLGRLLRGRRLGRASSTSSVAVGASRKRCRLRPGETCRFSGRGGSPGFAGLLCAHGHCSSRSVVIRGEQDTSYLDRGKRHQPHSERNHPNSTVRMVSSRGEESRQVRWFPSCRAFAG